MGAAVKVDDDALLGTLAAFRTFDADLRSETAKRIKGTAVPLFRKAYTQRASSGGSLVAQRRKLAGKGSVTFNASGSGQVKGYTTGSKALSGGLGPDRWYWVEFGTNGPWAEFGRLPWWRKGGYVFYPAAKATIPVIQRVYMRAVYDLLREAGADG